LRPAFMSGFYNSFIFYIYAFALSKILNCTISKIVKVGGAGG
jgi:hypothetical protein